MKEKLNKKSPQVAKQPAIQRVNPAVVRAVSSAFKETIIWTALPNGKNGSKVRLSAHASFRLTAPTEYSDVSHFPNALSWDPTKLKPVHVYVNEVKIDDAHVTIVTDPAPVQGLWQKYFPANGPVASYGYVPKAQQYETFHAAGVGQYLAEVHSTNVVNAFQDVPSVQARAQDPLIKTAAISPLSPPSAGGVTGRTAVTRAMTATAVTKTANQRVVGAVMGIPKTDPRMAAIDKSRANGLPPTDTHSQIIEATKFVEPYPLRPQGVLPTKPKVDFHNALAMLGQHHSLMRMVGVVIDVEIDASVIPPNGSIRVEVGGMPSPSTATLTKTQTVFSHGPDFFRAQPRPAFSLAAGSTVSSDMMDGYLDMSTSKVTLGTFDLAGSLLKMVSFANLVVGKATTQATQAPALMQRKLALGLAAQTKHTITAVNPEKEEHLPASRSSGISVYRINRAAKVQAMSDVSDSHDKDASENKVVALYADDVFKGWRPDIMFNGKWHSLVRRSNSYRIGDQVLDTEDEGQISFGMTTDPNGSGPSKVNESLFTWHGWSLAAPRPGKPITDSGQMDDSHPQTKEAFQAWSSVPGNLDPNYKVASFAKPKAGTLPRLRFGQNYGVRARFVDLAGNSLPFTSDHHDDAAHATSQSTLYLRFEPILAPSLYMKPNPDIERGDSANVVVIRKFAGKPTTEVAIRHIVPPEGGESQAETHGVLDDAQGKPDPAKYAMIKQVESRPPLTTNSIINADSVPPLPYLPDVTAEGTTLRVASDYPLPVLKSQFYNSDHKWPDAMCGKLTLNAATGAGSTAVVNGNNFTYGLLPGQSIDVCMSSNTSGSHLDQFNQTWALEHALLTRGVSMVNVLKTNYPQVSERLKAFPNYQPFGFKPAAPKLAPIQARPVAKPGVVTTVAPTVMKPVFIDPVGDALNNWVQQYIDGLNYALTPYRMVHLVHAVQVPEPGFEMSTISAAREASKTFAGIGLVGKVHGWSTQEVEFLATYSDDIDDLDEPKRVTTSVEFKNRAFTIPIAKIDHEPINDLRQQGVHEFHDTKCHFVKYDMVIKSRYRDYFPTDMPPGAFTQTFTYVPGSKVVKGGASAATRVGGQPVIRKASDFVIIPSSRRPDPANVEYIMPLFLWAQDDVAGKKVSGRKGNLLRIFLRRPWFSSGNGERLGVVLAPAAGLPGAVSRGPEMGIDASQRDMVAHFTTVMGSDPAFSDGPNAIGHLPAAENFPNKEGIAKNVTMVEGFAADVAYFTPKFDDVRQMWYVDMEVRPSTPAYMPFLRLVLGRYQPNSDRKLNVEMSSLTVTDITQLQPDRLAVLEVLEPKKRVRVSVAGIQGESRLGKNVVVGTLERKTGSDPDAGWSAVKDFTIPFVSEGSLPGVTEFQLFQLGGEIKFLPVSPVRQPILTAPISGGKPGVSQSAITEAGRQSAVSAAQSVSLPGSVDLPDPSSTYRVVLREYEVHASKTGEPPIPGAAKERQMAGRLIHVDVLPIPLS